MPDSSKRDGGNKTILVIVAHTDDETLGVGGAIARHVAQGDRVYALSMTDGVASRDDIGQGEISKRQEAALEASRILGFTWLDGGTFPDNAMDSVPLLSVVKAIENAKGATKPTLVYTHSSADLNIDHRVVSQATLVAFRPQPDEICSEIRTFEVASSTDYGHRSVTSSFCPNLYIDISDTWDKKLAALKMYTMEMRAAPHSRSYDGLENLAKLRGNQVGLGYAESFEILRRIER